MFYPIGFAISLIYFVYCNAKECKDESNFCNITAIDICSSTKTNKFCLATCGLCDDDITTDNNDITTVTPTEECSDRWINCTKLKKVDACKKNSNIAKIYCYKTCSNCTAIISPTTKPNIATQTNSLLTIISCILIFATMKIII
ncbi:Uncharacterized protein BM_BM816 [Brugia malayi]|uniref:ShKT domain-containing protein n=1 Tax=Brugia malayi TaxID=6279 RepID=A0A4E9FWS2_BRUMA|nr:Uncharacterized protein BM_BM816 [Brugia malayi]VIO99083.1 Uncharacterized protein BM_BM816 [Brugia malayi]